MPGQDDEYDPTTTVEAEDAIMRDVAREDESDAEYAIRRGRELHEKLEGSGDGLDDLFDRLEADALRTRDQPIMIVGPGYGKASLAGAMTRLSGLGLAMAAAEALGGPMRDRGDDSFTRIRGSRPPPGAVQIRPGVWVRDPANKPKRKFKGSKSAKKAARSSNRKR